MDEVNVLPRRRHRCLGELARPCPHDAFHRAQARQEPLHLHDAALQRGDQALTVRRRQPPLLRQASHLLEAPVHHHAECQRMLRVEEAARLQLLEDPEVRPDHVHHAPDALHEHREALQDGRPLHHLLVRHHERPQRLYFRTGGAVAVLLEKLAPDRQRVPEEDLGHHRLNAQVLDQNGLEEACQFTLRVSLPQGPDGRQQLRGRLQVRGEPVRAARQDASDSAAAEPALGVQALLCRERGAHPVRGVVLPEVCCSPRIDLVARTVHGLANSLCQPRQSDIANDAVLVHLAVNVPHGVEEHVEQLIDAVRVGGENQVEREAHLRCAARLLDVLRRPRIASARDQAGHLVLHPGKPRVAA
mmetsp:Transcript_108596/g.294452  ORF Transcript_108596/g.294452 Transcript_108596/m.294452 type:complete len:359 (-) Transcript_108596:2193-3269(-)